ncbi:MAG: hypothetical protein M3179_04285, partial [Actinomycetota bacterium]|nr:hypothetical protein [Actinomycetota bacterium]
PEPLAVRVGKKLRNDEALITEYSGARLRMDLDRVPLWRGDHVGVKQLWSDYTQYLYLPRLRDSAVLLDAVRSGVALLTWNPDSFAYASSYDDSSGRYSGLVGGQHADVVLDPAAVLVKPDVAARQVDEERAAAGGPSSDPGQAGKVKPGHEAERGGADTAPRPPAAPKRFYGRVSLDPIRMLRDLGDIADAVVGQLGRADAEVTITVEIEATAEGAAVAEVPPVVAAPTMALTDAPAARTEGTTLVETPNLERPSRGGEPLTVPPGSGPSHRVRSGLALLLMIAFLGTLVAVAVGVGVALIAQALKHAVS